MKHPRERVIGALAVITLIGVAACSNDTLTGIDDGDVDPNNQAPTARIAAAPLNVLISDNHTTVVTIDGSGSTDPDDDALTYSWVVPSGRFVDGTSDTDAVIKVTFPGAAPYVVTLTVRDGRGGSNATNVTIGLLQR